MASAGESAGESFLKVYETVGTCKTGGSKRAGIAGNLSKVAAGAGDNAAAAVGTGTVGDGQCNMSLGTSGTIFISSENFGVDPAQCPACICPCRRTLSSDGMHAECGILQ